MMTRPPELANAMDYTDVRKELTYADVERICLEVLDHRIGTVVVPSALVHRAIAPLHGTTVRVSCYIGYPFGTQAAPVKAREVEAAVEEGAAEIELVPHHGAIRAGRWEKVVTELSTVRKAAGDAKCKLVVEESYLSDEELATLIRVALDAGYTMIANTAGFRIVSTRPETARTATPEIVGRLLRAGEERMEVKAIGGIRTYADIARLLKAGASRIAVNAGPGRLRRLAAETEGRT